MGNSNSRRNRHSSNRDSTMVLSRGPVSSIARHIEAATGSSEERAIIKLIQEKKLAPKHKGSEEESPHTEECPICFLYHEHINQVKCCTQHICTECFLEVKKLAACPFCASTNFTVTYIVPALVNKYESSSNNTATPEKSKTNNEQVTPMSTASSSKCPTSRTPTPTTIIPIPSNTSNKQPQQESCSPSAIASSPVLSASVQARKDLEKEIMTQRVNQSGYFAYPSPKPAIGVRSSRNYNRPFILRYRSSDANSGVSSSGATPTSIRDAFGTRNHSSGSDIIDDESSSSESVQNFRRMRDRSREARLGREYAGLGFGLDRDRDLAQIEDIMLSEAIRLSMAEANISSAEPVVPAPSSRFQPSLPSGREAEMGSGTGVGVGAGASSYGKPRANNTRLAGGAFNSSDASIDGDDSSFAIDISSPQSSSSLEHLDMDSLELTLPASDSRLYDDFNHDNGDEQQQDLGMLDDADEDKDLLLAIALSLQEQERSSFKMEKETENMSSYGGTRKGHSSREYKDDMRQTTTKKHSASGKENSYKDIDLRIRPDSPPIVIFPPDYQFEEDDSEEVRRHYGSTNTPFGPVSNWEQSRLLDNNGQDSVYNMVRTVNGQTVSVVTPPDATTSNSQWSSQTLMDKIERALGSPAGSKRSPGLENNSSEAPLASVGKLYKSPQEMSMKAEPNNMTMTSVTKQTAQRKVIGRGEVDDVNGEFFQVEKTETALMQALMKSMKQSCDADGIDEVSSSSSISASASSATGAGGSTGKAGTSSLTKSLVRHSSGLLGGRTAGKR